MMAIAKKPHSNQTDISSEKAAEYFIAGAERKSTKRERKTPILIRFDPHILARVDQAAERSGISRSAWVHFMISRALEQEER
jgi:predicted HicB family RNase H-like nuclease